MKTKKKVLCDNCPYEKESCKLLSLNLPVFSADEIEKDLVEAGEKLYLNEADLFESDVSERNLAFWFVHYFVNLHFGKYKGYNIDFEYNRNGKDAKYYYSGYGRKAAVPDMIIHKRQCNKYNLLYVEFKKRNHDEHDADKIKRFMASKIQRSTCSGGKICLYRYKHGVSVVLEYPDISFRWFDLDRDDWRESNYRLDESEKKLLHID